jgi:hypothetical protein
MRPINLFNLFKRSHWLRLLRRHWLHLPLKIDHSRALLMIRVQYHLIMQG